jgi:cellulose synthase (UDP-forming)
MINFFKSKNQKQMRKRQWGSEKNTTPLPILHEKPSALKITLSRLAIVLTIILWIIYLTSTIIRQLIDGPQSYNFTMEAYGYCFTMSFLIFSALMYLIARQGAFQRFSKHVRIPRSILDQHFVKNRPAITVLIPSYSEEPQVIRKTLISAALQEYPDMRIVLLIDDNPFPKNPLDAARLSKTHQLSSEIERILAGPYERFSRAFTNFKKIHGETKSGTRIAVKELAQHYMYAACWLNNMAENESIEDHVDVFLVEQVLRELANDLDLVGKALDVSTEEGAQLSIERLSQLYQRLVWIFRVNIDTFSRKKYASLSHEANKAMNLNAYIGLMGGTYRKEQTPEGEMLTPVDNKRPGDITIPDSEFILTLDADSILLRDYCLRLVYFLQQPDNANVAVAQTPYSSFRGAYSRIERLSGATTDVQHILHQGMTYYNATFWVGANAVIRKCALNDIAEVEWVGGKKITRFIQEHTVIEDTESSIDLALHGWKLINYPERLSYSATPPDFGSLIVQRRRWANGGLLILPKLWSHIRALKSKNQIVPGNEILLRLNYMASIAWSTFGLIFLLAYPYDGRLLSPLVLFASLPYFIAMACDLKYCGYNYSDIFRIYGFNIMLLPVNLAGVVKSLEQAVTAKKIPFARTPKVKNRTAAPLLFIITPLFIIAFSLFILWRNIEVQNWGDAAFAGFNAFATMWAIVAYIGIDNLFVDLWFGLTNWLYVEVIPQPAKKQSENIPAMDWKAVLYHGDAKGSVPHGSLNKIITDITYN